jgi:hypothetical protein
MPLLDTIGLDYISIEDAHRHNDLNILRLFKNTKVIFGVIKIADSTILTVPLFYRIFLQLFQLCCQLF